MVALSPEHLGCLWVSLGIKGQDFLGRRQVPCVGVFQPHVVPLVGVGQHPFEFGGTFLVGLAGGVQVHVDRLICLAGRPLSLWLRLTGPG